jgi:hypothetical protein
LTGWREGVGQRVESGVVRRFLNGQRQTPAVGVVVRADERAAAPLDLERPFEPLPRRAGAVAGPSILYEYIAI